MQTRLFRVIVYRQNNNFWIEVPEIPGCHGEGHTMQAALQDVRAAIVDFRTRPAFSDERPLH